MRRLSGGFTLLEVIVSLAVLSIGVAVVLQIFSGGLKNIHRIEMAHRAMSHGENVMSEILADGEILGPQILSGDLDEDFDYTAEIEEWLPPEEHLTLDVETAPVRLLSVLVVIRFKHDSGGKTYELRSLKAVALDQPGAGAGGQDPVRALFGQQGG